MPTIESRRFFRCLLNKDLFEQLQERLLITPSSKSMFNECRETVSNDFGDKDEIEVEKARRLCVLIMLGFSGRNDGSSMPMTFMRKSNMELRMHSEIFLDIERAFHIWTKIGHRLRRAHIHNMDALEILSKVKHSDMVIYADPPYASDAISSENIYLKKY